MKEHLREFDFLRAFAAIAVIVIHVSGPYAYNSRSAYFLNQLSRFAVPMFIILSGLLLFGSDKNEKGFKAYHMFLSKRFRKILIPYVVWSFIYIIYNSRNNILIILENPKSFILQTLNKLLFGSSNSHLYFVIIIIQFYILYFVIKFLIHKVPHLTLIVSFLISLFFQTAIYLQILHRFSLPRFFIPYYIFFPTWIFFFVFGMYFSMFREKFFKILFSKIHFIAITWIVSLAVLLIDNKYTGTFTSSIKPSVLLYCIFSFLFFYLLATRLKEKRWMGLKVMDWLSIQSFFIYLSHMLVLKHIKNVLEQGNTAWLWRGGPGMIIVFLITVILTCILAYAVSLTPYAQIFGGARIRIINKNHQNMKA